MLATNLTEALNALVPDRALSTPAELQHLYVARPASPLRRLEVLLRSSQDPRKSSFPDTAAVEKPPNWPN
jgi:hypothetical protein